MAKNEVTYVAFPHPSGRMKCGQCFYGRITRYSQRCKRCKCMNLAFELCKVRRSTSDRGADLTD
jgi:hypothetical protein